MEKLKGKAQLSLNNGVNFVQLPVYEGTMGADVIDVRSLYAETGCFTYDPGFMSTASCHSEITYIDGNKGQLFYRGYPIEELAKKCDYLETCYLLLKKELPNPQEKEAFRKLVNDYSMVDEQMYSLLKGFRRDAHPMAVLTSLVGAMAAFYEKSVDTTDPEKCFLVAVRLIAQFPTLLAMVYKYSVGEPYIYPDSNLSYSANFLNMMFAKASVPYQVHSALEKALDKIFILHADHEQNASTSTVRLCGSSGTNPFAAISSGIACLWGAAHGGANEACVNMLLKLQENGGVAKVGQFIKQVKDKTSSQRLMGFGHRVYKNYDPRAKIMQQVCHEVFATLGVEKSPLLQLAAELERIALEDDYFVQRQLYPNVDFYSGIVQWAVGIPRNFFTGVFALARSVGWIAQLNEMFIDPAAKISRPRQLFVGEQPRKVMGMKESSSCAL